MTKFKKNQEKAKPKISTASLPDIVFMLLFFFMVSTKMRDASVMVENKVPKATELVKLEHKNLVNTIHIGKPLKKYATLYGTAPRIQLGDKFATGVEEIGFFIRTFAAKIPEKQRPAIFTSLKVDSDVTMGIVSDVKTELRKAGQLKLNYSAMPRPQVAN